MSDQLDIQDEGFDEEPSLDQLERLRLIYGMFEKPRAEEEIELSKISKQSPSVKIVDKLNRCIKVTGTYDPNIYQILFNEVKDAKEKFENPSDLARQPMKTQIDINVPKGKADDIRNLLETTAKQLDDSSDIFLNDQQWYNSLTTSRIETIFEKLDANISSLERSEDLSNTLKKLETAIKQYIQEPIQESYDDSRWFTNLNERRLISLLKNAMSKIGINLAGEDESDRLLLRPIFKASKRICQCMAPAKKQVSEIHVPPGLASSRIEQILQNTAKEFQRLNDNVDIEIVEGMTNVLRSQIQTAMVDQQSSRTKESMAQYPGKLPEERLKMLLEQLDKSDKVTGSITNVETVKGLLNDLREKILLEMHKEVQAPKTVTIDVDAGIANLAKEKIFESMTAGNVKRVVDTSTINVPSGFTKLQANRFINDSLSSEDARPEWTCDVPVEKGSVRDRRNVFDLENETSELNREWVCDIPIEEGAAKAKTKLFNQGSTRERSPTIVYDHDEEVKVGLAKERANLFQNLEQLASTTTSRSKHDIDTPKRDGRRLDIEFENDPVPSDPNIAREEKLTQIPIDITSGYTKLMMEKLKSSYEKAQTPQSNAKQDNLGLEPNHAKSLKAKWAEHEKSALVVQTAAEKTTYVPKRFVSNVPGETNTAPDIIAESSTLEPDPTEVEKDSLTQSKASLCYVCKKNSGTNLVKIDGQSINIHKTCMRCSKCYTKLDKRSILIKESKIWCKLHIPVTLAK
ncbi:hypothetical protein ACOME3_009005 [Neoechinorhynchus agilis]